MGNFGTGATTTTDAVLAAEELVTQARQGLTGTPTLALLFSTTQYDTEKLVSCAYDRLGGIPMWGGSSANGVIRDGAWVTGEGGAAALMLVAGRPAGVGVAAIGDDAIAAGRTAAEQALRQLGGAPTALLTLAFMGPEEAILKGVAEVAPGVTVAGGTASDHTAESRFQQYANGHAYAGHVAIAAIGGPVGHAFTNGYRATGRMATVTRADGRRAFELDGRPAFDVYREWVGRPAEEIGGGAILGFSVQHPLLFHKDGISYAAHPVNTNADGSMDFGAAMAPGMVLELGENSVNGLIAEAGNGAFRAAHAVGSPQAVLMAYCGGRAIALGPRVAEIPGEIEHALGRLPAIGYLAYGEQGCSVPGIPTHADLSVSTLVFG